jgi:hypothetical protein
MTHHLMLVRWTDVHDEHFASQNAELPSKPDWAVCKHANSEMFKDGMPEIKPVPDYEDYAARADRDRMTHPIPARDDRCIALELKRQQARCRFSHRQIHMFKTNKLSERNTTVANDAA